MSKEELFAARYPESVVLEKLTGLYEKIRGTATAATGVQNPTIWPTWISTEQVEDSVGVTVNFITNHPVGQEEQDDTRVFEIGHPTGYYIPSPPQPTEQKVKIYGEEAKFITEYANTFIGEPLTSETVTNVQDTMKNIILYKWAADKDYRLHDSIHRTTDSSGTVVDTFYNPVHPYCYPNHAPWQTTNYGEWMRPETPAERFRRELKDRQAPMVIKNHRTKTYARSTGHGADFQNVSPAEIVALHLLRKMLTGDAFRNYLRRGIVSVTGASGLVYAIVRHSHLVEVYRRGKLLSTLCVYLKDKTMPPTDEVVAKMIIVQCDEHDIWRRANINWKGVPKDMRVNVNRNNFKEEHLVQLSVA